MSMESVALVVSGIAGVLALGAFGVTIWQITHQPTDTSVTELAKELKRSRKAEAMRVVREAAAAAGQASAPLGRDGQPLPFGPVSPVAQSIADKKAALRARAFSTRTPSRGNGGTHELT